MSMSYKLFLLVACIAGAAIVGCNDSPHDYGEQRPPNDQLASGDSGLQSKDVLAATDKLVADLLASPELNASSTQWTLVVDHMDDQTRDRLFNTNYDIFLQRLKTNISEQGHGRITLIENRAKFNDLRNRELEGQRDDFGQGGGPQGSAGATNPEFALSGTAMDLPNRATTFYELSFDVTNLRTRVIVWSRKYEVKVARD